MRRILIVGVAALTLSATAVVAWAGTGPVDDGQDQVTTMYHGEEIDPIVERLMEQVQGVWRWRSHDTADHLHDVSVSLRDEAGVHQMDQTNVDDHVGDRVHDAVRDQEMIEDPVMDMDRDSSMTQDHGEGGGRNH